MRIWETFSGTCLRAMVVQQQLKHYSQGLQVAERYVVGILFFPWD